MILRKLTKKQIDRIVAKHLKYLRGDAKGERADLGNADLGNADLGNADLRFANLPNANLPNANLRNANLRNANLRSANLRNANLGNADLGNADLGNADLRSANLRDANLGNADLGNADLRFANLRNANLRNANLRNANLRNANLPNADLRFANLGNYAICPEEGDFIGWKKVHGAVLKLLITGDRVSTPIGRKCRTSAATVLEAFGSDQKSFKSKYDSSFEYTVGKKVAVADYDPNPQVECTKGIHFFITRKEAEEYN